MVAESHPITQTAHTKETVVKFVPRCSAAATSMATHTTKQPRLYTVYVLSRMVILLALTYANPPL